MDYESGVIGDEEVAAWLRSPGPAADNPLDQDWELIVADGLAGDFPGHIAFYLEESIPSDERRAVLLNAFYVMTWARMQRIHFHQDEEARDSLRAGIEAAMASDKPELHRWAESATLLLRSGRRANYSYWCEGGWNRMGTSRVVVGLGEWLRRLIG